MYLNLLNFVENDHSKWSWISHTEYDPSDSLKSPFYNILNFKFVVFI